MANHRSPFIERLEAARKRGCRIGTCEPIVAELFYGLELSTTRESNQRQLSQALRQLLCWPLDRSASEVFGRLAADLRRSGRPMQTIDVMMAAIAFSLGDCTVVTTDSDLSAIQGLLVENWEADGRD